jgi:hypothetical protein
MLLVKNLEGSNDISFEVAISQFSMGQAVN